MTNADKFKATFGLYATELWAKPEKDFLEWLNADAELFGISEQLDTISRAGVMDALNGIEISRNASWYEFYQKALTAVGELPSAQPEPIRLRLDHELSKEEYERLKKDCAEQPIILLPKESAQPGEDIRAMCGECDAWNQYKNHPQPGWIPWDSGKFPEESGCYIVTAYDGSGSRVTFAKYQKRLKRWELTGARAYWRVLAWQPLPIPYREGGKETDGEA